VAQILTAAMNADELQMGNDPSVLRSAIVAALEAARRSVTDAAKGSIIDCTGEVPCVRRVLGTLPITKDGFLACQNSVVWHPTDGGCYPVPDGLNVAAKVYGGARLVDIGECYSSLEASSAAKAAMEGGKA
jgi:hypothetical protein